MTQASFITITTPKGFLLDGAWFGPGNPQTCFIAVHGLGSSMFANQELFLPLVSSTAGVLLFNNRGHDTVTRIKKIDKRKKRGVNSIAGGCAHEVFTDCTDDIAGAIAAARSKNPKRIILVGHSTGCQKSIYYLAHTKKPEVDAVVLLAPMSDYADFVKFTPPDSYKNAVSEAKKLIAAGEPHALLQSQGTYGSIDAQRFLSLYTPDSPEELFCYAQKGKIPKDLKKVKTPMLVVLAQKDEHRDRSMNQIAKWFTRFNKSKNFRCEIIPDALHSFWGTEKEVIGAVQSFLSLAHI